MYLGIVELWEELNGVVEICKVCIKCKWCRTKLAILLSLRFGDVCCGASLSGGDAVLKHS